MDKVLTKPAAPTDSPEQAALRAQIARIIQQTYSGDLASEFWCKPAKTAADQIMQVICSRR